VQCLVERLERSRWASYGLGEERSTQVVVDWAMASCAVLGDSLSVSWGYPDYAPRHFYNPWLDGVSALAIECLSPCGPDCYMPLHQI
jgi:hypothetical protein